MATRSWLDEEPPVALAFTRAGRLFLAGLRRRTALILAGALYAALLAGAVVWMKYSYRPEYVLRVVESERDSTGMPRPQRELAEYVRKAVLTSEALLDVIHQQGLYPSLARKNPRAALESFREDMDIDVRQNYFVEERPVGAAPRSARLIISYRTADADLAVKVTRELGELVVKREQAMRQDEAMRAADLAKQQADEARDALALRRAEVASMRAALDHDTEGLPERRVKFIGLLGSLPALEAMQDDRERRQATLAVGAALEKGGVGMTFEVVDDGVLPSSAGVKSGRALVAGAAFVFGLPLLAVALGAFAPRKEQP